MLTPFTELLAREYFFSDRSLMGQQAGETVLQWEVFQDGLRQFREMTEDQTCHNSPAMKEEEQWVLSDESEWPFSFVSLCEKFGMEPTSVRHALLPNKSGSEISEQVDQKKKHIRPFS